MEFTGWDISSFVTTNHILGIVACFLSLVLFLHPLLTCWRVWVRLDSGDLQPYPYMAAELYSMFLTNYAFSLRGEQKTFKNRCLYSFSNVGFAIETIYILIVVIFSRKLKWYTFPSVVIMYFLIFLIPAFASDWFKLIASKEGRDQVLGPLIIASGILMYTSPMFAIVRTYKTKRVESLPFFLCAILGLYGLTWMIYSCLPVTFDFYFTIINGIGAILAVLQLGVCCALFMMFRKLSTTNLADDVERCDRPNGDEDLAQRLIYSAVVDQLFNIWLFFRI